MAAVSNVNGRVLSDIIIEYGDGSSRISIINMLEKLSIYENIYTNQLTATMTISDSVGLLYKCPLVGMERVTVIFDSGTSGVDFALMSIPDMKADAMNSRLLITMISYPVYNDMNTVISKAFKGKPSSIIEDLVSNYLKTSKPLVKDESSNEVKFVSNFWTPLKCISYCQSIAIDNSDNMGASFLFYETLDNYKFSSVAKLLDQTPVAQFVYDSSYTRDEGVRSVNEAKYQNTVLAFRSVSVIDQPKHALLGTYKTRIQDINPMLKQIKEKNYSYYSDFNKMSHLGDTSMLFFGEESMRYAPMVTFQDTHSKYNDLRADIEKTRMSVIGSLELTTFDILVNGNKKVTAGSVINFTLPAFSSSEKINAYLSGNFLVTHITHDFVGQTHGMTLRIGKDSYNEVTS